MDTSFTSQPYLQDQNRATTNGSQSLSTKADINNDNGNSLLPVNSEICGGGGERPVTKLDIETGNILTTPSLDRKLHSLLTLKNPSRNQ